MIVYRFSCTDVVVICGSFDYRMTANETSVLNNKRIKVKIVYDSIACVVGMELAGERADSSYSAVTYLKKLDIGNLKHKPTIRANLDAFRTVKLFLKASAVFSVNVYVNE